MFDNQESEPDGYGDNIIEWSTVSLCYGEDEAYLAVEANFKEEEWQAAIAKAKADGFDGDLFFSHVDEYKDGSVSNYTLSQALQVRNNKTKIGHRSFSSMTSWIRCGKAWQLERDFKVPSQPAWWFVGGTSFHTAVERFLTEENTSDNDDPLRSFNATLRPEGDQ